MIQTINATSAKNQFGEMMRQVYLQGNHVMIQKDDLPVVAVIPLADYVRFIPRTNRTVKQVFPHTELADFLKQVHKTVPKRNHAQVQKDINNAIKAVRVAYPQLSAS